MTANTSATGGFLTPTSTTMVEDAILDEIMQGLVVGATSLPGTNVRPRWQLIPEPMPNANVDWCAIGVVDETPETYESWMHFSTIPSAADPPDPTGDGYTISSANRVVTVLASFYGPNGRFNATMMRQALNVGQNREYLFQYNIALVAPPSGITTMTQEINQKSYRQQDIRFDLRIREATTWPILNLKQAVIVVASERPDTQTVVTPIPPP